MNNKAWRLLPPCQTAYRCLEVTHKCTIGRTKPLINCPPPCVKSGHGGRRGFPAPRPELNYRLQRPFTTRQQKKLTNSPVWRINGAGITIQGRWSSSADVGRVWRWDFKREIALEDDGNRKAEVPRVSDSSLSVSVPVGLRGKKNRTNSQLARWAHSASLKLPAACAPKLPLPAFCQALHGARTARADPTQAACTWTKAKICL